MLQCAVCLYICPLQLEEEKEEEEARLMETKEDSLRRLRQKVSAEKEKEERSIREQIDRVQQELLLQLNKEKVTVLCIYIFIYICTCIYVFRHAIVYFCPSIV